MKVLFGLLVMVCFCCQKRVVPVHDYCRYPLHFGPGTMDGNFAWLYDTGYLKVETFKLGKGDTLYRKVVLDSSWIEK
jgi:hypothetical protein